MSENLWPTDFGDLRVKTPVSILREQGQSLGERTANVVVGRVMTQYGGEGKFRQMFQLYCAPLAYTLTLLYADHDIELYPVDILLPGEESSPIHATDPEQFRDKLKEIFSRDKTKKVIASFLAQSKA